MVPVCRHRYCRQSAGVPAPVTSPLSVAVSEDGTAHSSTVRYRHAKPFIRLYPRGDFRLLRETIRPALRNAKLLDARKSGRGCEARRPQNTRVTPPDILAKTNANTSALKGDDRVRFLGIDFSSGQGQVTHGTLKNITISDDTKSPNRKNWIADANTRRTRRRDRRGYGCSAELRCRRAPGEWRRGGHEARVGLGCACPRGAPQSITFAERETVLSTEPSAFPTWQSGCLHEITYL